MRLLIVSMVVLAVFSGCNEGPATVDEGLAATSGSRLRAMVGRADDGAAMTLGWWDSERGEACSFVDTAPRQKRCLPLSALYMRGRYFRDGACTEPVIEDPRCDQVYAYTYATCPDAATFDPGYPLDSWRCAAPLELELYEVRPGTTDLVWELGQRGCQRVDVGGRRFFGLARVDLADFVSMSY